MAIFTPPAFISCRVWVVTRFTSFSMVLIGEGMVDGDDGPAGLIGCDAGGKANGGGGRSSVPCGAVTCPGHGPTAARPRGATMCPRLSLPPTPHLDDAHPHRSVRRHRPALLLPHRPGPAGPPRRPHCGARPAD